MIVVDSNIIAYCWVNGPLTALAQRIRVKDPDWHVPILWRSEMRSILAGYFRDRSLSREEVAIIADATESALAGNEHLVASARVLDIVSESRLSAYDAEFVALAISLSVPLVTADKAILKAFPEQVQSMEGFLAN